MSAKEKVDRITDPEAVRSAVREFDEIGQDRFLKKYGFGRAHEYFLVYEGRLYDSKAIVGVAHAKQFPTEGPLLSTDFSGGDRTAGELLRKLKFKVLRLARKGEKRDASNWTRDEAILALDLYFRINPLTTTEDDPEIIALTELLNRLPIHIHRSGEQVLRNPSDVYTKLCNLPRFDPNYAGSGFSVRGRIEELVWNEFANDRVRLTAVVESIRAAVDLPSAEWNESIDESDLNEASEGKILSRLHRTRERNRELVRKRKERTLKQTGALACEVCEFDFLQRYGEHGNGFIECHHKIPLSTAVPGSKTQISDLVLVCANCHRMLHRGPKWLSIAELKRLLKPSVSAAAGA